ncbi:DUF420 domain-containing protein [Halospeciosus flavus]|uniref:DUF420 domain-containing protein n=1 Tax=Halospeciosus flavus TaxID=3032283 RepID=UPI00360D18FE
MALGAHPRNPQASPRDGDEYSALRHLPRLYLYHIVVAGTTGFPGPEAVYQFVYLPILVVHMLLAMCCIPLVVYALLLGVTHSTDELPRTPHPRVGRVAASLWIVSFALGVVVYLLLHVVY